MGLDKNNKRFKTKIETCVEILERELKDKIDEIWLFGSVARGEANYLSDIDLYVSMKDEVPNRDKRFKIYNLLCDEDENKVSADIRFCVKGDIKTFNKIFNDSVKRDKIVIRRYK